LVVPRMVTSDGRRLLVWNCRNHWHRGKRSGQKWSRMVLTRPPVQYLRTPHCPGHSFQAAGSGCTDTPDTRALSRLQGTCAEGCESMQTLRLPARPSGLNMPVADCSRSTRQRLSPCEWLPVCPQSLPVAFGRRPPTNRSLMLDKPGSNADR
jgi:hypothetical protein